MSIGGYIKNKQPLVYRTFSNALESGKLAHAYLLLGEAGTPLKEAAMYLAKSVLCDYPNPLADEECIICRRIEMNDYPDFIFYDGEENSDWNHAEDAETHNTQHTIISSNVFDKLEDGVSVADWIVAAVNGEVQSHGLALLEK